MIVYLYYMCSSKYIMRIEIRIETEIEPNQNRNRNKKKTLLQRLKGRRESCINQSLVLCSDSTNQSLLAHAGFLVISCCNVSQNYSY